MPLVDNQANCPHNGTYLGTTRKENGDLQISEWCSGCDRWMAGGWSHQRLRNEHGLEPADLPIVNDYISYADPCAYTGCDNIGSERHHYGPRAVFGDEADNWPVGPLCRPHHQEWHRRTGVGTGGWL